LRFPPAWALRASPLEQKPPALQLQELRDVSQQGALLRQLPAPSQPVQQVPPDEQPLPEQLALKKQVLEQPQSLAQQPLEQQPLAQRDVPPPQALLGAALAQKAKQQPQPEVPPVQLAETPAHWLAHSVSEHRLAFWRLAPWRLCALPLPVLRGCR